MNPNRFAAAVGLGLLLTAPLEASQTLACDIAEQKVTFNLRLSIGYGTWIGSIQTRLELKGGAPWLPAKTEFTREQLIQHWIDEPEVRLWLHTDEPELDLVLRTRQVRESDYKGTYRISVKSDGKTWQWQGKVKCSLGY